MGLQTKGLIIGRAFKRNKKKMFRNGVEPLLITKRFSHDGAWFLIYLIWLDFTLMEGLYSGEGGDFY